MNVITCKQHTIDIQQYHKVSIPPAMGVRTMGEYIEITHFFRLWVYLYVCLSV